jgi:hypothetical protein
LRREIVESPVDVALHRARTYTRTFQANESKPWIVRKGLALREHLRTVPLYRREGDRIAGSISETPGAMPLMVEIGIGENNLYTGENPKREGYLRGKVPAEIWDYWLDRNLWGRHRAMNGGRPPRRPDEGTQYKFISCQGHLSPSYAELLENGIDGIQGKIRSRRANESDPERIAFLTAAGDSLSGLSDWIGRYAERCWVPKRLATQPPDTFHEAMQLIWFAH